MEEKKIRIAITHGDTNGIGYEMIFKTFAEPAILELFTPIVYGSPKIAAYHRKSLDMQANFSIINKAEDALDNRVNLLACIDEEVKVELGTPTDASAHAAQLALERAKDDLEKGLVDALVALPCEPTGTPDANALTIHVNGDLRIASVTGDIPLGDALRTLRKELIVEKSRTFADSLRRDFRISNPRIALLQVNPQAGAEEKEILQPAISELRSAGIGVFGPYPADEYFSTNEYNHFDGTLTLYQSQALTPLRLLTDTPCTRLFAGLSTVVTAPASTPNFELAGKGTADESELRDAIYLAIDAFRHRAEYDKPLANPLKKLYHEKRDESEKVRFSIPKKHEQPS